MRLRSAAKLCTFGTLVSSRLPVVTGRPYVCRIVGSRPWTHDTDKFNQWSTRSTRELGSQVDKTRQGKTLLPKSGLDASGFASWLGYVPNNSNVVPAQTQAAKLKELPAIQVVQNQQPLQELWATKTRMSGPGARCGAVRAARNDFRHSSHAVVASCPNDSGATVTLELGHTHAAPHRELIGKELVSTFLPKLCICETYNHREQSSCLIGFRAGLQSRDATRGTSAAFIRGISSRPSIMHITAKRGTGRNGFHVEFTEDAGS